MMGPSAWVDVVDLDATHPSLDHHRPGGMPLFGTALSIDAMVAAVRRKCDVTQGPPARLAINNIIIELPCIIADGSTHRLMLAFETADDIAESEHVFGRLFSPAGIAAETTHLQATLAFERSPAPALIARPIPQLPPHATTDGEIYQVYFHGPSFQVVATAALIGHAMVSRLSDRAELSNLSPSARLIEFGLQTSGLLELARTGRMMIPHAIRHIEPANVSEQIITGPIYAIAEPAITAPLQPATDVTLINGKGDVILVISGYETVALPFASDMAAAERLGALLAGPIRSDNAPAACRS